MATARALFTTLSLSLLLHGCVEPPPADQGFGDSPAEPMQHPPQSLVPAMTSEVTAKSVTLGAPEPTTGEVFSVTSVLRMLEGMVPPHELTYHKAIKGLEVEHTRDVEMVDATARDEHEAFFHIGETVVRRKGEFIDEEYHSNFEGQTFIVSVSPSTVEYLDEDRTPVETEDLRNLRRMHQASRFAHDIQGMVGERLDVGLVIDIAPDRQDILKGILGTESTVEGTITYQGVTQRGGEELAVFEVDIDPVQSAEGLPTEMGLDGTLWLEVATSRVRELVLHGSLSAPSLDPEQPGTKHFLYESRHSYHYD